MSSNSSLTGVNQIITGNGSFNPCNVVLNMCAIYEGTPPGTGDCTSSLNTRTITCNAGYTWNATAIGQPQVVVGNRPVIPCTSVDMCGNYTNPTLVNGICFQPTINQRNISCFLGYSSTNTINGASQSITGSGPFNNCTVILDMCGNYSSPVVNGVCVFNASAPGNRTVLCDGGWSTSERASGTVVSVRGTTALPNCTFLLDMCQAYSPPELEIDNHYDCSSPAVNTRIIICHAGYSSNATIEGITQVIVGNSPPALCDDILDMCLYSPTDTLRNATCIPGGLNTRVILCLPGYSTNASTLGIRQEVYGTGPINPNCLTILDMCDVYSPNPPNATCFDSAINTRTITCVPGFGILSNKTPGAIQTILGPGPFELCQDLSDTCFLYSSHLENAVCVMSANGIRNITCDDGWSTNGTLQGLKQFLSGSTPHENCSVPLDMCLFSPNNSVTNPNGKCVSKGFNTRVIICDTGYAFSVSSPPHPLLSAFHLIHVVPLFLFSQYRPLGVFPDFPWDLSRENQLNHQQQTVLLSWLHFSHFGFQANFFFWCCGLFLVLTGFI